MANEIEFFKAWCKVAESSRLCDLWGDKKGFTEAILKGNDSVTKQVAEKLSLAVHHEYYSLDAVFYDSESDGVVDEAPLGLWKSTVGNWLTRFRVALEHENVFGGPKGVYQEVCHLLTTVADLKVLVTYPNQYSHKNDEAVRSAMSDLSGLLPRATDTAPFLIILGFLDENRASISWEAWNRKGTHFERLTKAGEL